MKEFDFLISGYNKDDFAIKKYHYKDGIITELAHHKFYEPSFVIGVDSLAFTYTKNPLHMVAMDCSKGFEIIDELPLNLGSMTHLVYSKKHNILFGASYLDGVLMRAKFLNGKFSELKEVNHKKLYSEDSCCHAVLMNEDEAEICCINIKTDTLYFYDFDLNLIKTIELHKGCGPRHGVWIKDTLYIVTEYSNEVIVVDYNLGAIQYVSTLPTCFTGETYGATIFEYLGKLYASNRGVEDIAVFEIGKDKLIKYIGSFPCNGIHPRHMINVDEIIISCNKNSHNVSFINLLTGKEITSIDFPNPAGVCVIK